MPSIGETIAMCRRYAAILALDAAQAVKPR
jgi:hypothetical protein